MIGSRSPWPCSSATSWRSCSSDWRKPTAAPTLTVSHDPTGDRTLSWTAVTGASECWVFKTEGHAGCNLGKVLIAETASTSYVDSEVANNRDYYYSVMAVGSNEACFGEASACPSGIGAESDYDTSPGEVVSSSSYEDTWTSDDVHEELDEEKIQGNAHLTHVWRFEQVPAGDHELVLEGWRTHNGAEEDDHFDFFYSTDGTNYTQITNARIDSETETPGGNAYSFGTSSISGTVYIKVQDSDDGSAIDTLSIDYLAIRVTSSS